MTKRIRLWPQRARLSETGRWALVVWWLSTFVCLCGLGIGLTVLTDYRFDRVMGVILAGAVVLGLGALGLRSHFTGSFKAPGAGLRLGVVVAGMVLAATLFIVIPYPWSVVGAIPAMIAAYLLAARLALPAGYMRALRCYQQGDFVGMQAILDRMKRRKPHPHAYNLQGLLNLHLGDDQAALEAYQRMIELQPDLFHAHAGLSEALIRMGRYDEAVEAAQRMLELASNLGLAHYALGKARYYQGDWLEASAHLADALGHGLRGPSYLLITHHMLSRCHQELGHPEKVAEHRAAMRKYREGLAELTRIADDSAPTPYTERVREDLKAVEQLLGNSEGHRLERAEDRGA